MTVPGSPIKPTGARRPISKGLDQVINGLLFGVGFVLVVWSIALTNFIAGVVTGLLGFIVIFAALRYCDMARRIHG